MANTCAIVIAIISFCTVFITGIVLFACSFSLVQLDEYGLIYDHTYQVIEPDVHTSGRYFTGIARKFIIFPRKIIFIEFTMDPSSQSDSLSIWNAQGLSIQLDLSIFLSLNKDKIRDMYFQFGDNWYANLVRISQVAVKDTTTNFTTIQYFQNRSIIKQAIISEIKSRFAFYTKGAVNLIDFQLRQISFSNNLEQVIIQKLISEQYINTSRIMQTINMTLKQTEYIRTNTSNNISLLYAQAAARGEVETQLKYAEGFKVLKIQTLILQEVVTGMAGEYANLFNAIESSATYSNGTTMSESDFGLNDQSKLQFIYANELSQMQNTPVLVGIKTPLIKKQ